MKTYEIEFLTESGWKKDRNCESESLAFANFYAIGKANIWKGHVRIVHDGKILRSTLTPPPNHEGKE